MSGPDNQFEEMAVNAVRSIENSRELARQLTLLPDEVAGAALVEGARPKRGQGKALNQMREWLAGKGYRLPEDILAEIAGLGSRESAMLTAMMQTEQILAWAGDGAVNLMFKPGVGHVEIEGPWRPTPEVKRQTFMQVYATMLRAAEAMLPYGAPKVTPDAGAGTVVNQIVVQGAPSVAPAGPSGPRDVTPKARRIGPPPMPGEVQQIQGVSASPVDSSDGEVRTE
jgi:hypothetical protein